MTDPEKAAADNQKMAIGLLPAGSIIRELPPFSKYIVSHPNEPMKVITLGGAIVVLK